MLLPLLWAALWGGSQAQYPIYQLEVQEVVRVPEGLCVLVPCRLRYPRDGWTESTPAYGFWYKDQRASQRPHYGDLVATNHPNRQVLPSTSDRFQLVGEPRDSSCSLWIREAQVGDSAQYFFRLERGPRVRYSFLEHKLALEVIASTPEPVLYMPETLEPGRQVTIVCVSNWTFEGCPAPAFSWRGAALSAGVARSHAHFSMVTLTPRVQDHDTALTCQVDFPRASAERTVQLRVAHAPGELRISTSQADAPAPEPPSSGSQASRLDVREGRSLQLLCTAGGWPPATLSWALGDRVLAWSPSTGSRALALTLPRVQAGDAGRYTCRAENRLGAQSRWLDLAVQSAPDDLRVTASPANRTVLGSLGNGTTLPVLEGQSLRLLCVTDSNPPARLSWALVGHTLSPSQSTDPGVLELVQIQREQQGELTCLAQHPLGSQRVSLHLLVQYPPRLLGPSCSPVEDGGLLCSCSAVAQPAPALRWRLGEQLLEGSSSNGSLEVTFSHSGLWANSSVRLGALSPDLTLSCEAQNPHGTRSTALLLQPGEKGLLSKTFSHGTLLGTGATTLLFCLTLILVKTLRRKGPRAERVTRRSTILDYINVVPRAGPLARNRKPKPSGPSQPPPPRAVSPDSKGNQEQHFISHSRPGPKPPTQAPEAEPKQEDTHYAMLNFQALGPREAQAPRASYSEYAEVKFY